MVSKIDKTIDYYMFKRKEILEFVNSSSGLSVEKIIECGEELAILEYKITALQIAKEI
jgi:hypothetical protein